MATLEDCENWEHTLPAEVCLTFNPTTLKVSLTGQSASMHVFIKSIVSTTKQDACFHQAIYPAGNKTSAYDQLLVNHAKGLGKQMFW